MQLQVAFLVFQGEVGPAGKPGFEGGLGPLGSTGPRGMAVQGKAVSDLLGFEYVPSVINRALMDSIW